MNRRAFLKNLLGVSAVTAAGLLVPSRTTYCFLTNNPLATEPMGILGLIDDNTYANCYFPKSAFARALDHELTQLKASFVTDLNQELYVPVLVDPNLPRGSWMAF